MKRFSICAKLMSVTSNSKQQQSKYTRSKTAMAREEKYTSYKNVGKKTISLLCQLQENNSKHRLCL
jgi:hypothetical protein